MFDLNMLRILFFLYFKIYTFIYIKEHEDLPSPLYLLCNMARNFLVNSAFPPVITFL